MTMKQLLEDDILRLRALEPEDLDVLYKWENDTSLWEVGSTLSPYSRYILKQYIERSGEDLYTLRQLRLLIERKEDLLPLGLIDLYDFEPKHRRAGVGIFVEPSMLRRGIGYRALALLHEYAFSFLCLHQLYAHIPVGNVASTALLRKAGYEECGLLREWVLLPSGYSDVRVMQKINPSNH